MRSPRNLWTVVGVFTIMVLHTRAQDADWQTAAKEVVNYTADLLRQKVKGDADALAGLKHAKEQLLKDEKLRQVAEDLQRKLGTEKPEPDKLKGLRMSIEEKIKATDARKIKVVFKVYFEESKRTEKPTVVEKSADLPWPFGKG